jgi:hypothetical protein
MEETPIKFINDSNFLSSFLAPKTETKELSRTQKREIILEEIYTYYVSEKDKRKKENWKRYCVWCRAKGKNNTPENQKSFKKTTAYIREMNFASFKWCMKHLPLEDFYVVLSEVKDRSNRGNNVSSFLGGLWFKNV